MRNFPPGSLVTFEHGDRRHFGQVYSQLEGDLCLVLTPTGESFIVYSWGIHRPSERDAFGRVAWPEWKPGDPVERDPEHVRGATNLLLRKPSVIAMLNRILARRDRKLTTRRERSAVADSWTIPYATSVRHGGYHELSPYFLAYLDRDREHRAAEEKALALLRSGKAGRGSERQYEVLLACYYGSVPLSWIANAWGVNRSTVHRQFHKGLEFLGFYVPIDNARAKRQLASVGAPQAKRSLAYAS